VALLVRELLARLSDHIDLSCGSLETGAVAPRYIFVKVHSKLNPSLLTAAGYLQILVYSATHLYRLSNDAFNYLYLIAVIALYEPKPIHKPISFS
jgi:hypothetical protein